MTAPRRAIVIGINKYADDSIVDLRGARNDAEEMRDRLIKYGDFQIADNHFLVDEQARADPIRRALSDLLWRTDEAELSVIFFSGHGFNDSYRNGFIAPHDMLKQHPLVHGIRMQDITDLMLAAQNKRTILLLLDCCYSGIAAGDKAVSTSPQQATEQALAPLEQLGSGAEGRIVFSSSGADEVSREASEMRHRLGNLPAHPHGNFTYQLLEGLDGRARRKGSGVTVDDLIRFVQGEFVNDAAHAPKHRGSSVSGDAILTMSTLESGLTNRLDDVRQQLNDGTSYLNLIRAALAMHQILDDSPELVDAISLRVEIDERLRALSGPARRFLVQNELDLAEGCEKSFNQLTELLTDVSVDRMRVYDRPICGVLAHVFRVTDEPEKIKDLQMRLLEVDQPLPMIKSSAVRSN